MSQHFYQAQFQDRPVTIQMGWDRPLQGYYMLASFSESSDDYDEDVYLYSNLDDEEIAHFGGVLVDAHHFLDVLGKMGITLPQSMIAELTLDKAVNRGNRQVWYDSNGTISVDSLVD